MNLKYLLIIGFILFFSCKDDSDEEKQQAENRITQLNTKYSFAEKINERLLWKIKDRFPLHEQLQIDFNDSVFIDKIHIKHESLIKDFKIAINYEIIEPEINGNYFLIKENVKQINFVITEVSETDTLKNLNSDRNSLQIIEGKKTNTNFTFRFYKSSSELLDFKLNADTVSLKYCRRFINFVRVDDEESYTQSVTFVNDDEFLFFRTKDSGSNPQEYSAFCKIIEMAGNKASVKVDLYNLLDKNFDSYNDIFIFNNSNIQGGYLFKYIKTMIHSGDIIDLGSIAPEIKKQIKYASEDNFLNEKLYDCDKCYLRFEAAKDLIKANNYLRTKNLALKVFDCYRPLDVQKKMWEIIQNPGFVADPATGSRHNRANAVDVTLVDNSGNELNMGTEHDYFGPEAATFYSNLPVSVKKNRILLRETMSKFNFEGINSEWWHFNHSSGLKYKVMNYKFYCL